MPRRQICLTCDARFAIEENAISVLLGHNPGSIDRGLPIEEQPHPQQIPVGIPSQLLEDVPTCSRRGEADRGQCEDRCCAGTVFPADLSHQPGWSGEQPTEFNRERTDCILVCRGFDLGTDLRWRSHPQQLSPVRRRRSRRWRWSIRRTILNSLKDVSNSLTTYKETREQREEETAQVKSAADAVRLARLRYSGGNTSYLRCSTTDTDLYSAQLLLAQAQQQDGSLAGAGLRGAGWRMAVSSQQGNNQLSM